MKNELELTFTNSDSLTIQTNSSSIRTTIEGIDNIKMYWLKNELTDAIYLDKKKKKYEIHYNNLPNSNF